MMEDNVLAVSKKLSIPTELLETSIRLKDFMITWMKSFGTLHLKKIHSSLSAIYDSFKWKVLKVVESKNGHHFY